VTGQVRRGQINPANREHLRAWLARFAGCEDVAFEDDAVRPAFVTGTVAGALAFDSRLRVRAQCRRSRVAGLKARSRRGTSVES
jgi:hypothetical protein